VGPGSDFERELLEAMMEPLGDRSAASSLLPYIVRAPAISQEVVNDLIWHDFVHGG
jgi:hypothetical protein